LADELALLVYRFTTEFPKHEQFGLTSQMRRAAVSVASNIVEGCARRNHGDYVRFLDIANGSACELQYQATLAFRLGYLPEENFKPLHAASIETNKVLSGLLRSLQKTEP
jgi:four helix bundle protein